MSLLGVELWNLLTKPKISKPEWSVDISMDDSIHQWGRTFLGYSAQDVAWTMNNYLNNIRTV